MTPDLILIADPDGQARKALMALYAAEGMKAIAARSLQEARSLLAHNAISACLVAGALADLTEFDGFITELNVEHLFTYGAMARAASDLPHLETAEPSLIAARLQRPFGQKPALRKGSDLILIGASTGGISALETVLRVFPEDCPPTLIVQHMRDGFAEGMAARFDQILRPHVVLVQDSQPLRRGTIYLAAGSARHLYPTERNGVILAALLQAPPVCGHCPSVDLLFRRAAVLAQRRRITAALLTGMGNDGAEAMALLRAAGAHTIAQDEASAVVWGMPRAAIELGAACEVLPLSRVAPALLAPLWNGNTGLGKSA